MEGGKYIMYDNEQQLSMNFLSEHTRLSFGQG